MPPQDLHEDFKPFLANLPIPPIFIYGFYNSVYFLITDKRATVCYFS